MPRRLSGRVYLPIILFSLTSVPSPIFSASRTALICDHAAQVAASETGVPLSVLRSITRTETGRIRDGALQPWPWTVNMEGAGKWFETEDAARTYVFKNFKRGARSFDVGCFQINYKWHHQAFHSIDEMFDPVANARYAAQFLTRLHNETGNWSKAAGAYHSRTPVYAKKYRARFDGIHQKQMHADQISLAQISSDTRAPRVNTFPLLQGGSSSGRRGSLVPLGAVAGQSLFKQAQPLEGS